MNEEKIKAACLKMMEQGWKIRPHLYINNSKECCPLVALAMVEGTIAKEERNIDSETLSWALMVSMEKVESFVTGFDQDIQPFGDSEMIRMGKNIRRWFYLNQHE